MNHAIAECCVIANPVGAMSLRSKAARSAVLRHANTQCLAVRQRIAPHGVAPTRSRAVTTLFTGTNPCGSYVLRRAAQAKRDGAMSRVTKANRAFSLREEAAPKTTWSRIQ